MQGVVEGSLKKGRRGRAHGSYLGKEIKFTKEQGNGKL